MNTLFSSTGKASGWADDALEMPWAYHVSAICDGAELRRFGESMGGRSAISWRGRILSAAKICGHHKRLVPGGLVVRRVDTSEEEKVVAGAFQRGMDRQYFADLAKSSHRSESGTQPRPPGLLQRLKAVWGE